MKKNSDISIVVPSYNEVENIKILLQRIDRELPGSTIVIVDDSSPAENRKLTRIIARKRNVTLILRMKKSGRGSAVIEGFKEALKNPKMNWVFEMDSDLAHDPKEFKRFLEKRNSDSGLIIGSRYLPGEEL